jgi:site-specific recombinase XerC
VQFVGTHRGLSARTERKYVQQLSIFAEYLEGAGIKKLGRITPLHVREFYENARSGTLRNGQLQHRISAAVEEGDHLTVATA